MTTHNEHTERAELTDAQIDEIAEQHATGQDDQDRYIVTTAELHEIIKDAAAMLEAQPAEQAKGREASPSEFIKNYASEEDGWCEWVCPKPVGYLMKCCDCGLVHEADFRVVRYANQTTEEFEVVQDDNLQAQLRMRRKEETGYLHPHQIQAALLAEQEILQHEVKLLTDEIDAIRATPPSQPAREWV